MPRSRQRQPTEERFDYSFVYKSREEENEWLKRCAVASLMEVQSAEVIQEFFLSQGVNSFKVIPMGATEVLLEFESEEEMEQTVREAKDFLEEKFLMIKQCSKQSVAANHLIWIRIRKVPLHAWTPEFFMGIATTFGR